MNNMLLMVIFIIDEKMFLHKNKYNSKLLRKDNFIYLFILL